MGKQPQIWAPMQSRVSMVATHPRQPVVATGYADGMVLLVRVEDGAEILARRPDGGAISAMGWDKAGGQLAFGTESGDAGVLPL